MSVNFSLIDLDQVRGEGVCIGRQPKIGDWIDLALEVNQEG